MTSSGVSKPEPRSFLIKEDEGCPGAPTVDNPEHNRWFEDFETMRAFPGSLNLDDLPARHVQAMVAIENEAGFVDAAASHEDANKARKKG